MRGTKVYVVTCGVYSDYEICAVFLDEGLAQNYVAVHSKCSSGDGKAEIEEYIADEFSTVWTTTLIHMKRDGTVISKSSCFMGKPGFWCFSLDGQELVWMVKTENEERAIKVTNEKRAQILALDLWGDNEQVRELFLKGGKQ